MHFPDNLQIFATHGAFSAPGRLESRIRPEFNERLRKNFSDWATWDLITGLPDSHKHRPNHGRIAIDPARALDAEDAFRTKDFGGIEIFQGAIPPELINALKSESWNPYHAEIRKRLLAQHGDTRNMLLVIDLHDTGNLIHGERLGEYAYRQDVQGWTMPMAIISNKDGLTAPDWVMHSIRDALCVHLGFDRSDVLINTHFKGGYVTQRYGDPNNSELDEAAHVDRAVVQVEILRSLYLDEDTQIPLGNEISGIGNKLVTALSEVADGLTHKAKD